MRGYCETIALPLSQLGTSIRLNQSITNGKELKGQKTPLNNQKPSTFVSTPHWNEMPPNTGEEGHDSTLTSDMEMAGRSTVSNTRKNLPGRASRRHSTRVSISPTGDGLAEEPISTFPQQEWLSHSPSHGLARTTSETRGDMTILRNFIQQHQQFLATREKFVNAIKPSILFTNSIYNLLITVSMIRLHTANFSDFNQFSQPLLQTLVLALMSFSYYLSSETLDSGNEILYKALTRNNWYRLHPAVGRLLFPVLVELQRPKRFIYFGGALDVCFRSFLTVMKFSYSLFTILKRVL